MVTSNWLKKILCILLFFAAGYFFIRYWYARFTLAKKTEQGLVGIARERKEQIIQALISQRAASDALAQNAEFVDLFSRLSATFKGSITDPEYKKIEVEFDKFLNGYQAQFLYKDIVLIQPDGSMFYTSKMDLLKDKNLLKLFNTSALAQSFERARLSLTIDVSEFSSDPVAGMPALFICVPVMNHNTFMGVVAVLIDEEILYKIIQNYDGLGKTGDIFVTKQIVDRVLFVAPSRLYTNVAFKKITNPDKYAVTPARRASLGYAGSGVILDSFGIEVAAAWLFVPQVDLGLTDGIQMTELLNPYSFFRIIYRILLFILCCALGVLVFDYRRTRSYKRVSAFMTSYRFLKAISLIGFMIALLAAMLLIYLRYQTYWSVFNATKQLAEFKVHTQVNAIEQYTTGIERVAQSIAQDLRNEMLKKEDLTIRLQRDLKEFPDTVSITVSYAPFRFDSQRRLYALQAARNADDQVHVGELTNDYMIPGSDKNPLEGWFDKALKKGAFWSYPFYEPEIKKQLVLYALPFYLKGSQEPDGVVMIVYRMDKILQSIRQVEVGKTGYPIITSLAGRIIYHPLAQYASQQITLLDITQEQNNPEFKDIMEEIKKKNRSFDSYFDTVNGLRHWIYFEHIKSTNWVVAVLFSQESLDLPLQRMHKQEIWILILLVIAFIFLITFLVDLARFTLKKLEEWAVFVTALLVVALIAFWIITGRAPYQANNESIIIRDQISLDKYIAFLNLDAEQRNEKKPIIVPTGILINSISLAEPNKITVSLNVWQKFKSKNSVMQGIRFPESTVIKMREILNKEDADAQIVGWDVEATFFQKHRFSWFPFDRVHVDLVVTSIDFENNVILVPDFGSYKSFDIDPLPGVSNELNVPGFTFERSFFSYLPIPAFDEVGLELLRNVTEKPRLHYNLVLARKLTNPFIVFLLPLLIILFSIYAIFLVSIRRGKYNDMFQSLSAYVAVFFSLILLHQTLRSQYQAGELLYIEYFFFFTYITILLLIVHVLTIKIRSFQRFMLETLTPYFEILFWPIEFGAWFIVTMITFYTIR